MRCRITLKAENLPRTVVIQYNAGNYLDAILVGRSRVYRRTAGWRDSGRAFRWTTELQNRRMQWQIIEAGNESTECIQEDKWAHLQAVRRQSRSQRSTQGAEKPGISVEELDAQEQQERQQENLVQRANGLAFEQLRQWATSQEVTTDDGPQEVSTD